MRIKGKITSKLFGILSALLVSAMVLNIFVPVTAQTAVSADYTTLAFDNLDWKKDRKEPSNGYDVTHDSIQLRIDGTKRHATDFYRFEGLAATLPEGTTAVKSTVYVDPAWEGIADLSVEVWVKMPTTKWSNTPYLWPVLRVSNDSEGKNPTAKVWSPVDGIEYGDIAVNFDSNITFEFVVDLSTGEIVYYANGNELYRQGDLTYGYGAFETITFNSVNVGKGAENSYEVVWTNLQAGVQLPDAPVILTADKSHVSGTALSNSTVVLTLDDTVLGNVPTNETGEWRYTFDPVLTPGTYTVLAHTLDVRGASNTVQHTFTVTKPTDIPPVVLVPEVDDAIKDAIDTSNATFTYNEAAFTGTVETVAFSAPTVNETQKAAFVVEITQALETSKQEVLRSFALNIAPLDKDGNKLQLSEDGTVDISVPLPKALEGAKNVRVYHVSSDGTLEALETKLVDGIVTFTATQFSDFIFVEVSPTDTLPAAGLESNLALGGFLVAIGTIVIIIDKRRRNKYN